MARAKSNRKRPGIAIPLAIVAGFMPGIARTWSGFRSGGLEGAGQEASKVYLGYDPASGQFDAKMMWFGLGPLLLSVLVHKGATWIGLNRILARTRLPVRI